MTGNFDDDHVKRSACVFEVQDGGPGGVIEPWLIRWAVVMMRLWAAGRNTSMRRTTTTAPD